MVLMVALVQQKKKNINFNKENTKCCLSFYYNGDASYFFIK